MIWLDRAPIEAALGRSKIIDTTAVTVVTERLARLPADNVEIGSTSATAPGTRYFRTSCAAPIRCATSRTVSAFTCSKMRPDGFGGMAVLITPSEVMGKSTSDIIEDFLNEAVPDWADEPARSFAIVR